MLEYWRSTVGKKQFVAVTGAILVGYLILLPMLLTFVLLAAYNLFM